MARVTHIVGADRRQALQPPARLGDGVIDQRGDEPPRRLVERAGSIEAGIGCAHFGKRAAGKRHLGKLGEGEKAGAIAVIDVMIVVGDVVGERRKLCFDRGVSVEREILPCAIIDDRGRDGWVPLAQQQRTVVLDQALERLPGEVEPIEAGVFPLKLGDHAQGLGIVVETALLRRGAVERPLPGMAERRMTEVVGKSERLGQILIDAQGTRH